MRWAIQSIILSIQTVQKDLSVFLNPILNQALERVIKLDNYPTAIVEELIGKASSIATEKGYQQEIIHSCIDNSIEGIILPQLKTGLLNIPAYIDYGYSVYKLMDNETVQDMQEALTKSHEYFAKALKIHDDWKNLYYQYEFC